MNAIKLVRSSIAGHVERDQALHLLTQRALLTRIICRELLESKSWVVGTGAFVRRYHGACIAFKRTFESAYCIWAPPSG
jgi:hypothetical protein